jgi:hypothetical protein
MTLKGYRTSNGGYITIAELKMRQRKLKKEDNEARIKREKEQELKTNLLIAQIREEKEQVKKDIENKKYMYELRINLLNELKNYNPFAYKQYLILWDIVNSDYTQIQCDLENEKITKSDIIKVIEYIDNFSDKLIDEYLKNELKAI